jgi:hypothetical protein
MNRIGCLTMLLEFGADIYARTFDGLTPHDIARKRKFRKIMDELRKYSRFNDGLLWSKDDLFYENNYNAKNYYGDSLFKGLTLHKIDTSPRNLKYDGQFRVDNELVDTSNYDSAHEGIYIGKYSTEIRSQRGYDPVSFHSHQIPSYPVETFYLDGVLWYVYFDSNRTLYYVRVKDNHSQVRLE